MLRLLKLVSLTSTSFPDCGSDPSEKVNKPFFVELLYIYETFT